ncbi:MAG: alpha-galactosidase [Lachnospiraceae bacterium]|nr:alpha-galactosidase [Lachnospiraceae bacterium]
MINEKNLTFELSTKDTTYAFRVTPTGHLEHLHYGRKIHVPDNDALTEKHEFCDGNAVAYDEQNKNITLEDMNLEMSSYGKGDIREPFVVIRYPDGSVTSDFIYESFSVSKGKDVKIGELKDNKKSEINEKAEMIEGSGENKLPGSYGAEDEVSYLCIKLTERHTKIQLELHYYVYEKWNVITRSARLVNSSEEPIILKRLMSMQLDFPDTNFFMTTFNGEWAREMGKNTFPLKAGKHVNSSFTGTSSSRANPFVMLHKKSTDEDSGQCYGFNLVYSGNHYEAAEVSGFGKTRLVTGINPEGFEFALNPGEELEAPEAVMTFSAEGFNKMSRNMHGFIRNHIVRGKWKNKERPILINSWEAAYFNIDEKRLLSLAKKSREAGIELFVMDDGWFGERNDDTSSLGDWEENKKKLPGGIKSLSEKINDMGLEFGIWVEPEMINVNSNLYKEHPEWVMDIPGREHSEGRNQRLLDLGNEAVQEFVIESMTKVFSAGNIAYVKWDMNRNISDCYSKCLPFERQGEASHRYVLGLYRCMRELTKRFPDILFEGCSSGGNRFDLGILCYFPQIWASDNTDAYCRSIIQTNYSYGYPMNTLTSHVSGCPNHQTLRKTPLDTRFNVAAFGVFGYECNLCDMKSEEFEEVKNQVEMYKQWRKVLQLGDFYRGRTFDDTENVLEWTCVADDKTKAVGMIMQKLMVPNSSNERFFAKGLDPSQKYVFANNRRKYNIKEFGDLVNTVSPIHIKQDSLVHNLAAKFVKMDGEEEHYKIYGDVLMYSGIKLSQAFAGTGYNEKTRYFPDYGSRMYFVDRIDCDEEDE